MRSVWAAVLVCGLLTGVGAPAGAQAPSNGRGESVPIFRQLKRGQAPGMHWQMLSEQGGVRTYAVIFSTGDEVLAGLTEFAEDQHLGASRITGIGALERATLGWLDLNKKAYRAIRVPGQVEVTSMLGDIALLNGKPSVHVHMTVAHPDGHVTGGHLIEAHVRPTLEVIVTEYPNKMQKGMDESTGMAVIRPQQAK